AIVIKKIKKVIGIGHFPRAAMMAPAANLLDFLDDDGFVGRSHGEASVLGVKASSSRERR
ncbi:MAG: hypothetical protein AB7L65_09850, partial [Hyphomonadaceae bacterium]